MQAPTNSRKIQQPIRAPEAPKSKVTGFRLFERPALSLVQPEDKEKVKLTRMRGELFVDGPSPDDIRQGPLGDCYFIAALASVAAARPDIIRDMVRKVGPNVYEVRFYDLATGRPVFQRVTSDVLVDRATGKPFYARSSTPNELWPIIVEKAFAARFGGYAALNAGTGWDGLSSITGMRSLAADPGVHTANQVWASVTENLAKHQPTVAGLPQATLKVCKIDAGGLPSDHYYSVVGSAETSGQRWVILREPHAMARYHADYDTTVRDAAGNERPGVFRMKLEDFRTRFRVFSWMTDKPLQRTTVPAAAPVNKRIANAAPPAANAFPCPS